jgi:hypothetical protein
LSGYPLLVLFDWTNAGIGRDCGPHVRFIESYFVCDQISLGIATALNLHNQASQDLLWSIFFSATQKPAIGLDAGAGGD